MQASENSSKMAHYFKYLVILFSIWAFRRSHGDIFSFKMHQRFSEPVKQWSEAVGKLSPVETWPQKGSAQYYTELAAHDRLRRGRRLSEVDAPLTFSDGNSTFRISSLGFLHYTSVELGTPGQKFMVALDTGSDLFWVPCDCSKCAPTGGASYASDFQLSIYSPKASSTSKRVACANSICAHHDRCTDSFGDCPYVVSYVSAETSTSGILVEDVLHLVKEDGDPEDVQADITFGCGQVQSGSFLDVAAPNGLLGLGMAKISVPSVLSREGLTADSFSMCFGRDGVGRINFGDKGSLDQEETQFNLNPLHPTYNISVTQIRVGTTLIDVDITSLFDTGTSFTYFVDPIYTKLTKSFHSQVKDTRRPPDSKIPFEFCYDMSPDANTSLVPSLSLEMDGGSYFTVYDPIAIISTQTELAYCLAVVKSSEVNIIGQNFMTGYRIVFDRERLVLGWKKYDCYEIDGNDALLRKPLNTIAPAVAARLNHSIPESTEQIGSSASNSIEFTHRSRIHFTCFRYVIILLLLL